MEWLFSYIKVLSREHIVSDYASRQAIVNILRDLSYLASTKKKLDEVYTKLTNDDECWKPIVKLMLEMHNHRESSATSCENYQSDYITMLYAIVQYHLNMTIFHRLSDLQVYICLGSECIKESINGYNRLKEIYDKSYNKILGEKQSFLTFPSREEATNRYMKSIKSASMTTDDDIPCFKLANTFKELSNYAELNPGIDGVRILANYIYLENCRMLYSGMNELNKIISNEYKEKVTKHLPAQEFDKYMEFLNSTISFIISRVYKNPNDIKVTEILRQNSLANFCDFWHKSSDESSPIDSGKVNELTYMYQYFNILMSLHRQNDNVGTHQELPYKYEELCRTICGMTDAKMGYLVYGSADTTPEIIAQSGYYVPYIQSSNCILDPYSLKRILNIINDITSDSNYSGASHVQNDKTGDMACTVVHGIYKITYQNKGLLVIEIPPLSSQTQGKAKSFYVVVQRDQPYDDNEYVLSLRHARNILFLREVLQDVLSRHYIILSGYKYDCSYVRRIHAGASTDQTQKINILHISDIHMCQQLHDDIDKVQTTVLADIKKTIMGNNGDKKEAVLKKIDLLAITGDIADCQKADVMHLRKNYQYAEELLNSIIIELWSSNNYLPSDWKHRVPITTGNHDFLSEAIRVFENDGSSKNKDAEKCFSQLKDLAQNRFGDTNEDDRRKTVLYIKRNYLFDEISYYVETIRCNAPGKTYTYRSDAFPCNDERISKLIYHIHESIVMSNADKAKYLKFFEVETGDKKAQRFDLVLAGHIHIYDESENNLVSGMMYNQNSNSVSGYVIEIDTDNR